MIVFSISLKSKVVAKDWQYTCKLLKRTLSSIYNQTNQDFKVILVCHEKPEFITDYPNLICHEVDFPPPQRVYSEMVLDRNVKELIGRQISQKFDADYIMNIDADDCIWKGIAEFCNNRKSAPNSGDIFFIDKGYIYYESSGKFVERSGFYRFCGSTVAIKSEYCESLNSLDFNDLKTYIEAKEFYSGGYLINYLKSLEKTVEPFPFYGCIYVRPASDPGLATSKGIISGLKRKDIRMVLSPLKRSFEKTWKSKELDKETQKEFGFYPISR